MKLFRRWSTLEILTFAGLLALVSGLCSAQTPAKDSGKASSGAGIPLWRKKLDCDASVDDKTLKTLSTSYHTGDWKRLQELLTGFIEKNVLPHCKGETSQTKAATLSDASFSVLFIDREEEPNLLVRVVVRKDPEPGIYSARVVGPRLLDLTLIPSDLKLKTNFSATPVQNPLAAALPKVLAQVSQAAIKGVPQAAVFGFDATKTPPVAVYEVVIPPGVARAQITVIDAPVRPEGKQPPADSLQTALTTTYAFGPLTHLDFAVGTSALLRTSLNQQVKTDNSGKIVDDTPTGVVTFIALDWHPWGYDESLITPSWQERFRVFIGPALTPQVGIVAGSGYAVLRGLSLQAGYGVLLSKVLRKGDQVGSTPIAAGHPSRRGALGVLLAGIEYSFQ